MLPIAQAPATRLARARSRAKFPTPITCRGRSSATIACSAASHGANSAARSAALVAVLIALFVLWFYLNLFVWASGAGWFLDGWVLVLCLKIGWPLAALAMLFVGVLGRRMQLDAHGPLPLALLGAGVGVLVGHCGMRFADIVNDEESTLFNRDRLISYALAAITGLHCALCYYALAVRSWRRG